MRRSSLLQLQSAVFVRVPPDKLLEVEIVPAAAALGWATFIGTSEDAKRRMCTEAFIGFRGYTDDNGQPVENTLEHRMELYEWLPCRQAIHAQLTLLSEAAAEGEGSAVSASPATESES